MNLISPMELRPGNRPFWSVIFAGFCLVGVVYGREMIPAGMAMVPAGSYQPFFSSGPAAARVAVASFALDMVPVSNDDYLKFVRACPQWRRSEVARVFADGSYLKNWSGDLTPGSNAPPGAPVVYVSWFAARAYARWEGKRLPSTAEWELAAAASPTRPDGANDPAFKRDVLRWYAEDTVTEFSPVNGGEPNYYGIKNLHGLVWEWVADFNSGLSGSDENGSSLFCGAGAQNASQVDDYPAFMRFALRSSLHGDYCIHNLGFRCAKDLKP